MHWDELPALFPGFPSPGRWLPLLRRHLDSIEAQSERTRVTSVPPEEAVRRQYAESLELLRIAREAASFARVTDVGSGGGYPGLVIAIVAPDLQVDLVEPLQKRARLLGEIATALGLGNVMVHPIRAEEAGRGPLRDAADLVTARAVASLPELLEYTAPLARLSGFLALAKGSGFAEELAAADNACSELKVDLAMVVPMREEINAFARVAVFRKGGPTDPRYPRRAGTPGKRPL